MNKLNQRVQMTSQGYQQLADELELLEKTKLPEAIDRVAKAREFGDLSENAEYHSAKDDLSSLEGRIEELKDIVNRVKIVENVKDVTEVGIGSTVNVLINDQEHEFIIVGEWEADPVSKKISHESPLGRALIGKKIGEEVHVEAPAGKITYKIKSVK